MKNKLEPVPLEVTFAAVLDDEGVLPMKDGEPDLDRIHRMWDRVEFILTMREENTRNKARRWERLLLAVTAASAVFSAISLLVR